MDRRAFIGYGMLGAVAGATGCAVGRAGAPARGDPAAGGDAADAVPLRLNSNENPLGPSPAAREALATSLGKVNRYPDEARRALVESLAERHDVGPESILLGCGSTEVLQMSVQALCGPEAPLVLADPTFEAAPEYAAPTGGPVERVPLDERWAHDLGRMRERARASGGGAVVYICDPNNPTGTLTPRDELEAWVREAPPRVWFLVDEAYHDYVDDPAYRTAVPWTRERPNVVVARTFSKVHGLAGLRLGYGISHPRTAERIRPFMSNDNANGPALAAALASLRDGTAVPRAVEANRRGRRILVDCLDELGLGHIPSQASFVMHEVPGDLETHIRRMADHGVQVGRPFPPLLSHNRVSIGRPEEMERFADVLRDFRRRGWV